MISFILFMLMSLASVERYEDSSIALQALNSPVVSICMGDICSNRPNPPMAKYRQDSPIMEHFFTSDNR